MIQAASLDVVIFDGDSATEGVYVDPEGKRPSITACLLGRPIRSFNFGVSGDTIIGRLNHFEKNIAANYNTEAKNNIVSLLIGVNDLIYNHPFDATWRGIHTYCTKAKALGFKIALGTYTPRIHFENPLSMEQYANIGAMNDEIRQNAAGVGYALIDYANHPIMGHMSSCSNTELYSDGVHPTARGYSLLAEMETEVISTLFA